MICKCGTYTIHAYFYIHSNGLPSPSAKVPANYRVNVCPTCKAISIWNKIRIDHNHTNDKWERNESFITA